MAYALQPIAVTGDVTLDPDVHGEALCLLDKAAGLTVTLPAATGSGTTYRLLVKTTVSSNSTIIQVADANDTMVGNLQTASTTIGANDQEAAGGTDDTITMNGTTTGGIAGSYVELTDAAANLWLIAGSLVGSGTIATSLSAAVS